jgi:hypothetical protein
MASTASRRKLTLRMSNDDSSRLDALCERRRLRIAQADGVGPPDRLSRTALALHYLRLGMTQAEKAARVTSEPTPSPDPEQHRP